MSKWYLTFHIFLHFYDLIKGIPLAWFESSGLLHRLQSCLIGWTFDGEWFDWIVMAWIQNLICKYVPDELSWCVNWIGISSWIPGYIKDTCTSIKTCNLNLNSNFNLIYCFSHYNFFVRTLPLAFSHHLGLEVKLAPLEKEQIVKRILFFLVLCVLWSWYIWREK